MMRAGVLVRAAMALMSVTLLSVATVGLTGCGMGDAAGPEAVKGVALQGVVHGGQQPVTGAQIELFAAGNTGNGLSATSLLEAPVFADARGSWSITADYKCPSASSEVYIMAVGGNPGLASGTNNTAITLVSALGQCGNLTPYSFIVINEVTTVATAYALAGFIGPNEAIGSSSTNTVGLQNAFATVNNLVDVNSGVARLVTPGGHGIAPQEEINTLADMLSSCVNTAEDDSLLCTALLTSTLDANGEGANDVFGGAVNLAHNPSQALPFALVMPGAPFQPTLTAAPTDWSVGIVYAGGGLSYPNNIAIDGLGNVWVSGDSIYSGFLAELSALGVPISPTVDADGFGGYDIGNAGAGPIAIDSKNNIWMPNTQVVTGDQGGGVVKLDDNGNVLSPDFFDAHGNPQTGYAPDSLSGPQSIVVDKSDNVWISNSTGVMVEVSNGGMLLSPATDPAGFRVSGYAIGANAEASGFGVAVDRSNNLWIANANQDSLVEMSQGGFILTPPPNGIYGGGLDGVTYGSKPPIVVALDTYGNILTLNSGASTMSLFSSSTRTALSPDAGYNVGGYPVSFFVDSLDNIYISDPVDNSIEVWNGNSLDSGIANIYYNPEVNGPNEIAGDASGNLWVTNFGSGFNGTVTELVGLIAPTATPLCVAAGLTSFVP